MTTARVTLEQVGTGKQWSLDKTEIRLGRTPSCEVCFDGNEYPMVGREHARIRAEDQSVWVEDLASMNGTFVNGEKISRRELSSGDVLRLGSDGPSFRMKIAAREVPAPAEVLPTRLSPAPGGQLEPAEEVPTRASHAAEQSELEPTQPGSERIAPETPTPIQFTSAEDFVMIERKLNGLRNLVIALLILVVLLGGLALGEMQQISRNRDEIQGLRSELYGTASKYKPLVVQQMDDLSKRLDTMQSALDGVDAKIQQAGDRMAQRLESRFPVILDRYLDVKLKQLEKQAAHAVP